LGRGSRDKFSSFGSSAFPALTSPRNWVLREVWPPNKEPMPAFHNEAIPTGVTRADRMAAFAPSSATRAIGVAPPPDREQAFARAKRRSGRVRLLRLAILIGGLGAVGAMVVVTFFNPFATKLASLGFNALSVEGTKIVMDRPKLAGFRSDGQAYVLTAERALQDIKQPSMVQLRKVDGEIGAAGGEATHLSADEGVYDNLAEHMELSGNVRIKNGRFTVLLRSARFDFKSGAYGSDDRVEVQGGDGTTIFADRGSALNNGQELTFEGHVRTNIVPQTSQEPASEVKRPNP
jgi:lipopolysaccharide export system protein LptC